MILNIKIIFFIFSVTFVVCIHYNIATIPMCPLNLMSF